MFLLSFLSQTISFEDTKKETWHHLPQKQLAYRTFKPICYAVLTKSLFLYD